MDESHVAPDIFVPRYNRKAGRFAEGAREGMVLLKNEEDLLPLSKSKLKSIAVIGPDAYPGPHWRRQRPGDCFPCGQYSGRLSDALGTSVNIYYHRGIPSLNSLADRTDFLTAESNGEPD